VTGSLDKNSKRFVDADVDTGVVPTPDPLSTLPLPTPGPKRDTKDYKTTTHGQETYNLQPGTYKDMSFDSNDVVNMASGEYYIDGGNLDIRGEVTVTGHEVMIYNAGKKGFKIQSTGNITLTPPASGPYNGISLFQNPTSKAKVEFRKDQDLNISGIVYAPNSQVIFNGTDGNLGGNEEDWEADPIEADDPTEGGAETNGSIGAAIISKKLTVDKGAHIKLNGSTIGTTRPLRGVVE
jgi:hypothetical protein